MLTEIFNSLDIADVSKSADISASGNLYDKFKLSIVHHISLITGIIITLIVYFFFWNKPMKDIFTLIRTVHSIWTIMAFILIIAFFR